MNVIIFTLLISVTALSLIIENDTPVLNATINMASINVTRIAVELNERQLFQEESELRFAQREHRGGFCDCWAVANLTINGTRLQ